MLVQFSEGPLQVLSHERRLYLVFGEYYALG